MYFILELDIPDEITTETIVSYNAPVGCGIASRASQSLKVKLESSIQCAQNKTCTVAVDAKGMLSAKLESLTKKQRIKTHVKFLVFVFVFLLFLFFLIFYYVNMLTHIIIPNLFCFKEKNKKKLNYFRLQHPLNLSITFQGKTIKCFY